MFTVCLYFQKTPTEILQSALQLYTATKNTSTLALVTLRTGVIDSFGLRPSVHTIQLLPRSSVFEYPHATTSNRLLFRTPPLIPSISAKPWCSMATNTRVICRLFKDALSTSATNKNYEYVIISKKLAMVNFKIDLLLHRM